MKQEEKTAITRAKIIHAAMMEFGKKGYMAGSVNHICKTGINKGLIYYNFSDKDTLYLECVKISCDRLMAYIRERNAENSFADYMKARMAFFREYEEEAHIFMEARINPAGTLTERIQEIFIAFDALNNEICQKELSKHSLRKGITEADALSYFSMIQTFYNRSFMQSLADPMTMDEQIILHEVTIHKLIDLMLYGIAERTEKNDTVSD